MKALILRQDAVAADVTSRALIDKGFQILCVETLAVAHALIRVDTIDLLVMDERIDGQLTHAIALSGERRSPYLSAIILTDRHGEETDDLYDLIPCLYALAGTQTSAHVLGQLALCAVSNIDEAMARVNRRRQEEDAANHANGETAQQAAAVIVAEPAVDRSLRAPAPTEAPVDHWALSRKDDRQNAEFAAIFRTDPVMGSSTVYARSEPEVA